jgi:spectrin alpha
MTFYLFVQEHRTEIDARAGTFQAFELLGQQLLANQHYASDDVQDKLEELAKAREELEQYVPLVLH